MCNLAAVGCFWYWYIAANWVFVRDGDGVPSASGCGFGTCSLVAPLLSMGNWKSLVNYLGIFGRSDVVTISGEFFLRPKSPWLDFYRKPKISEFPLMDQCYMVEAQGSQAITKGQKKTALKLSFSALPLLLDLHPTHNRRQKQKEK